MKLRWTRLGILSKTLMVILVGVVLVTGCAGKAGLEEQTTLTVGAAASLQVSLNVLAESFMEDNPDIKVQFTYASSGILQQQIEQGSPIDVFVSAGEKQMDALDNKGFILNGSREMLATNEMVLVVPAQTESTLTSFADLNDGQIKKIALGNPATVPAGEYAKEVLESYGLYYEVEHKLVFGEDVRQALTMVGTGNADAGIVYKTDALANSQVKVVAEASKQAHSPIIYSIGIVKASDNQSAAEKWVEYCLSADGQAVLAEYGFDPK